MKVLCVEDNSADSKLINDILANCSTKPKVQVVSDGEAATEFLFQKGHFSSAPTPDLVLLDLNIPLKDGLQVLKEVKNDPYLRYIPIVILTSSERPEDIRASYEHCANGYVVKPSDLKEFSRVIKSIVDFWLTANTGYKSGGSR